MRNYFYTLAVAGALMASGCAARSRPEDDRLVQEIISRIQQEAPYSKELDIAAERSTIWISGNVGSEDAKATIESLVKNTQGVQAVHSTITVDPSLSSQAASGPGATPGSTLAQDEEVILKIKDSLARDPLLASHNLMISTDGPSVITVRGTAQSAGSLRNLTDHIKSVTPGYQVKNEVAIEYVSDDQIRKEITRQLNELPRPITEHLAFSVSRGIVTFRGQVMRHDDIDAVLARALMLNGVSDVKSEVVFHRE